MPKRPGEHSLARSRFAVALVKSGLAFGAVWVLALFALAARAILTFL